MRKLLVALAAGFLTAVAVTGLPASAADTSVAADSTNNKWNPPTPTVAPGDSVTFTNPGGGFHNVCVAKPGLDPASGCGEFRNGDPGPNWSGAGYTNTHTFATAGTYKFYCQVHTTSMEGTITVKPPDGTGTTNTETITDTITQPTNTTPTNTAPDTTAPAFTGKLRRKASRRSLILQLGSSEDATLDVAVFRRPPHGRSFAKVGKTSLKVKQGRNTVTVPRKAAGRVRSGAYRVTLKLVDAAGNHSRSRLLVFKVA
jgi:plastocyanin